MEGAVIDPSGKDLRRFYAIANTVALVAFGCLHNDQSRMRGHLYRCLTRRELAPFPVEGTALQEAKLNSNCQFKPL